MIDVLLFEIFLICTAKCDVVGSQALCTVCQLTMSLVSSIYINPYLYALSSFLSIEIPILVAGWYCLWIDKNSKISRKIMHELYAICGYCHTRIWFFKVVYDPNKMSTHYEMAFYGIIGCYFITFIVFFHFWFPSIENKLIELKNNKYLICNVLHSFLLYNRFGFLKNPTNYQESKIDTGIQNVIYPPIVTLVNFYLWKNNMIEYMLLGVWYYHLLVMDLVNLYQY